MKITIDELIEIIEENGDSADFSLICKTYADWYSVSNIQNMKMEIARVLNERSDLVLLDYLTKKWTLRKGKYIVRKGLHKNKTKLNSDEEMMKEDDADISAPKSSSYKGRLIVCRIAYMKYYKAIPSDGPYNGGTWVAENNDAMEKYNFLEKEDGYCYGFCETKYKSGHTNELPYANSIHLENIDPSFTNLSSIGDVRVVFVALSPILKKNVVVGWYDNATIYRNRYVVKGVHFTMKCKKEDAHLIPERERRFNIPKAATGVPGIGQSNYWYIQRNKDAKSLEIKLNQYIDSLKEQY